nr:T-box protein H15-like [Aedes albopictus]
MTSQYRFKKPSALLPVTFKSVPYNVDSISAVQFGHSSPTETPCRWDPMDALLLEQHLRSPLRLFPDPLMAQFGATPDPDGAQAALLEKARQHLQMWGRAAPYGDLLIPQMYQRPNLGALNLGTTPPPPAQTMTSPASSAGSPSPDLRAKHFTRFSPYQIPQAHHHQPQGMPPSASLPHQSPSPRSPSN